MGVLVTVALFVAVLSFLILNYLSEISIEKIWDSDRIEKENQKYIDEFKKFVSDNELKSTDKKIISKWVKEKKIISLSLYKHNQSNDISDYTYEPQDWSFLGDKTANQDVKYYTINFKDRNLQAVIVGSYDISIYHYSNVISLVISFIIMMAIVFAGMRREVKYIRTLYLETQILEGGNLEYEITVRGTDELSELAHEINSMRIKRKAFFVIIFILEFIYFYYLYIFNYIYKYTQIIWLISVFMTFFFNILISCFICLSIVCFRILALKKEIWILYEISDLIYNLF